MLPRPWGPGSLDPVMTDQNREILQDNVLKPEAFRRTLSGRAGADWAAKLTFRNVVVGLGLATFLIFLGSVVSARIAFLFAALFGLAGLVLYEMATRRRWESSLLAQLRKMEEDYDRIVREVARGRNDLAGLKKNIAAAGAAARTLQDDSAESRMIKVIAERLSKAGEPVPGEPDTAPEAPKVDAAADDQVLRLINVAVQQDRIDLFLQPIVTLPQRKVRFFEMFSRIRIRQGEYLPAEKYIQLATQRDVIPVIDNALLLRGLQLIRDTEEENFNRAFFCNISSLTLDDPKFMGDLVEFIAQNRTLAPRLIFEFGQRDLATMSAQTLPVLDGLARLGCRFSMDQVKTLSFDYDFLQARHIRFVKVDAAALLREIKEEGGFQRLKRLESEMDTRGIDVVAEKIETEKQLIELLDLDLDYGQGFLFGKPQLSTELS